MNIPKEVITTINVLLQPYGTSLEALTAAKPEKAEKVGKYYSLQEARKQTGFSVVYLRREIKAGHLLALKGGSVGSRYRIADFELEKWMLTRR